MIPEKNEDMTVREVVAATGLSKSSVHRLIHEGTFRAYKLDPRKRTSKYLVTRQSVEAFLELRHPTA